MNKQASPIRHSAKPARHTARPLPLCLAIAALCSAGLADATDLTWKGGKTNGIDSLTGRMSVGTNWSPNAQPVEGDILHFGTSNYTTVVNDLGYRTYKQISFETGASAFTLQGASNNIALTNGIVNHSSNVQTLDWGTTAGFVISADQTWDGGTAGLIITGGMDQQNDLTLINKASYRSLASNHAIGNGTTANAVLTIRSGSSVLNGNETSLGRGDGRSGTVIVQDVGSSFATNTKLLVGDGGDGWLQIMAGASARSAELTMGRPSGGGFGVVELTGTGSSLQTNTAWGGAGLLNIANGAKVQVAAGMTIGDQAGSSFAVGVGGGGALLSVAGKLLLSDKGYGRLDIQADGVVEAAQLVVAKGSIVNLQGGMLRIGLGGVAGTFVWESGTLNFTGDYALGDFLGHDMVVSAGQILKGDTRIRVGAGDSLALAGGKLQANAFRIDTNGAATVGRYSSLAATSLANYGRLMLDGGSVSGALLNAGYMTGSGSFLANLGNGGFTNSGRFDQGDYVELANAGSNINTGVWTLTPGAALQLKSSNLSNHGLMTLAGATIGAVDGASKLVNESGGTISGNGVISTSFSNQGSLIVDGGKFAVEKNFANGGQILLSSAIANLSGGAIDNTGRIEGLGQIGNAITNQGFVSAKGGTLTLAAGLSNSGTLTVGRDATLRLTQGLQPNTGKIQLAGGAFDNNGKALINQAGGVISGYGEVRSGPLTNNGLVLLSGGVSALYSEVVANADSQIILSGNSNTTFYGKVEVKDGAELRVSEGSVATFAAEVKQRNGADVNGDGKMFFEGGLSIGNSPGYGYIQGSVSFASSNVYTAEIGGIHACTTLSCAADAALVNDSFDKLSVGGNLKLGGKLVLTSWNGFVAQAGQSFDLLDWGTTNGVFKSIDAAGFMLAAGTRLDYSQLYSSGTISVTAVPEPESYALMLAGLGLLAWRRRKAG